MVRALLPLSGTHFRFLSLSHQPLSRQGAGVNAAGRCDRMLQRTSVRKASQCRAMARAAVASGRDGAVFEEVQECCNP
jgi:hypothetical protein